MKTQIEAKRAQLDAEAEEIDAALTRAVETKSYGDLDAIQRRVDDLAQARKELEREAAVKAASGQYAAMYNTSGDAGGSFPSGSTWRSNFSSSFTRAGRVRADRSSVRAHDSWVAIRYEEAG